MVNIAQAKTSPHRNTSVVICISNYLFTIKNQCQQSREIIDMTWH